MICVCGRIQIRTYNDESGQKRWSTEIIVEDQDFAESKTSFEARQKSGSNIDLSDVLDETDLPF